MIEYFVIDNNERKSLISELEKALVDIKPEINIGTLNSEKDTLYLSDYELKRLPILKYYGSDRSNPISYNTPWNSDAIKSFITKQLKIKSISNSKPSEKAVVELNDSSFEKMVFQSQKIIFASFYAPWCGYCKALKPEYEKAAEMLLDQIDDVRFVAIDATKNQKFSSKYSISGYPTILIFGPDKTKQPTHYNKERSAESLKKEAQDLISKHAPVKIMELSSKEEFDSQCTKNMCFFSIFPNILDSGKEERFRLISLLKRVAEKTKGNSIKYFWSEVGNQPNLEKVVNLENINVPAASLISLSKKKYIRFTQAFDQEHLESFLKATFNSNRREGGNLDIQEINIKTVKKWDEKNEMKEKVEF